MVVGASSQCAETMSTASGRGRVADQSLSSLVHVSSSASGGAPWLRYSTGALTSSRVRAFVQISTTKFNFERLGCLAGVLGVGDGPDDDHAGGSGFLDLAEVREVDAADREPRALAPGGPDQV